MNYIRKVLGYTMAFTLFISTLASFVVSLIILFHTLFFGLNNEFQISMSLLFLGLMIFRRSDFARLMMRCEAFAKNVSYIEYEKLRNQEVSITPKD